MKEIDFNLLVEQWVIVADLNGEEKQLSLIEVLTCAHKLRSLSGEMEAQDVAILRLLLGILYAIYTRTEEYQEAQENESGDMCIEIWRDLWERGYFPADEITSYLNQYHDRFWLVHPERPFYQIASLKTQDKSNFDIPKMLGNLVESANKIPLFSAKTIQGKRQLSYAEATRWLIHLNGFDDAALKKINKNTDSIGTGWLGQLGLIYVEGSSLFETLMLNFPLRRYDEEPWESSYATWELDEPRTGERTSTTIPKSGETLFTLQSRRILLKRVNGVIIGYVIVGGDHFPAMDAFDEPMTLWKLKKDKTKDFHLPMKEQNSSKQFWRDFSALITESEDLKRPGTLKWLDSLVTNDVITPSNIKICILNVLYGSQSSGIKEVWGDSVSINAGLISILNTRWQGQISKHLKLTGKLAECVGFLAADLELCKGLDEGEKKRNYYKVANEAKEEPYLQLDGPFRTWLASIDPANPEPDYMEETMAEWITITKNTILKIGKELVEQAGPQAFVGSKDINAVEAYKKFRNIIQKHLKEANVE